MKYFYKVYINNNWIRQELDHLDPYSDEEFDEEYHYNDLKQIHNKFTRDICYYIKDLSDRLTKINEKSEDIKYTNINYGNYDDIEVEVETNDDLDINEVKQLIRKRIDYTNLYTGDYSELTLSLFNCKNNSDVCYETFSGESIKQIE